MDPIKVLVVDDHALVRGGVIEVLPEAEEIEVIGEATNGAEGIEQAKALSPNVVIMDKLHLANRSQAAAYAVRAGIQRPSDPSGS